MYWNRGLNFILKASHGNYEAVDISSSTIHQYLPLAPAKIWPPITSAISGTPRSLTCLILLCQMDYFDENVTVSWIWFQSLTTSSRTPGSSSRKFGKERFFRKSSQVECFPRSIFSTYSIGNQHSSIPSKKSHHGIQVVRIKNSVGLSLLPF